MSNRVEEVRIANRALGQAAYVARRSARECIRTKPLNGRDIWVFLTLARIAHSAESVRLLSDANQTIDAKLIVRSIFEGMLDINYLLNGPMKRAEIHKLLRIENAEDAYNELAFHARHHGQNISHFAARLGAVGRDIVAEYELRRTEVEHKDRWMKISPEEKIRVFRQNSPDWIAPLEFTIVKVGNAVAHSRSAVLKQFSRISRAAPRTRWQLDMGPNIKLTTKPRLTFPFNRGWVVFEAMLGVLIATDVVVRRFFLGGAFEKQVADAIGTWKKFLARRRNSKTRKSA